MGIVVTVGHDNFASEVMEASYQKPVLVDFFATWCGPCQLLKPKLQALVAEYDFVLALVDIDQETELASQYGVEGVPDVRVVTNGEILPGFVGVLQDQQLRQLVLNLGLRSQLDQDLEMAEHLVRSGQLPQAKAKYDQLFDQYPDRPSVTLGAAQLLMKLKLFEDAKRLLNTVEAQDRDSYLKAQAFKGLVDLQGVIEAPPSDGDTQHPDLAQQFIKGAELTCAEDYETALEIFLAIVEQNRKYRNDGARKAMVTIFDLLGDGHQLTQTYRKRLTQALY
jgi:putative thioredoxin